MYLPETPPLPPIKPGDPDYDPFAKPPPAPLVQLWIPVIMKELSHETL